ncbi:hypothetical protein [Methanoregula sp.]|jgi:hypothetical protein|uniref:hypothetical protein n=1 Tax=Methanoregula sp. TaxID=2052170 RepID=UPI003C253CAF
MMEIKQRYLMQGKEMKCTISVVCTINNPAILEFGRQYPDSLVGCLVETFEKLKGTSNLSPSYHFSGNYKENIVIEALNSLSVTAIRCNANLFSNNPGG